MRIMSIDFGERHVGVALTDEEKRMAFPHGILPNDGSLQDNIVSLIRNKKVDRIVMGESRDFMGKPNPIMKKAKAFANELADRTGLPLDYESEGLTTIQALKARIAPQKPTASYKRPSVLSNVRVDDSAATLILQNYLEKKRREDPLFDKQKHERPHFD